MLPEHRHQFHETKSKLTGLDRRRADVSELIFYAPDIAEIARPGQFVMIGVEGQFLRRPMSIFNITDKNVHLLIRKVGKGSEKILNLRIGEIVNLLGPLGNGFPIPDKSLKPLLIAGGMGIAPLYFLYTRLVLSNFRPEFFYGENYGADTALANVIPGGARTASLDGRTGYKGLITDLLDNYISRMPDNNYIVYACGPEKMYETLASMKCLKEIPVLISLEERMACGIGACMGCSIKTNNGYKRVCKDGPVFYINELEL